MIVTLTNSGECQIVSSAFFEKCTELTSLLIINTEDKGIPWDSVTFSADYLKVEYWDGYYFSQVFVYPENDEEKKVIRRTRYELLCKSQQQFLFVDDTLIGGKI